MKKKLIICLIILGILLSIIDRSGFFNPVRNLFQNLTVPVQLGLYRTIQNFKDKLSFVTEISNLREKNQKLAEENLELKVEVASLKEEGRQLQAVKEQIGFKDKLNGQMQLANIIGFSPLQSEGRLTLDKGQKEGVKAGDIALVKDNLIGVVVLVTPRTAIIQLLTDPESKIAAYTLSGAKGLLVGQFKSEARLTKVLQNEKLEKEELVLTLGDTNMPKGLVLGKVSAVLKDDKQIFQEAKVDYLISVPKLKEVFLLKQ